MSLVRSLSPDVRLSVTSPFADLTDVTLADEDTKSILVESRSWRDRNLKFGLIVIWRWIIWKRIKNLASPRQIFNFFPNYPPPDHN